LNKVLLVFVTDQDNQAFLEERNYKLDGTLCTGSLQRGAGYIDTKEAGCFDTIVFVRESKQPIDYAWYAKQVDQFVADLRAYNLMKESTVFV